MSDAAATTSLDQRRVANDAPTREKVFLWMDTTGEPGKLAVRLHVPLDPEVPAEAAVRTVAGAVIQVEHTIEVDLDAERAYFGQAMTEMYSSSEGQVLRGEPLRALTDLQLRTALKPFAIQGQILFHRLFVNLPVLQYPGHEDAVRKALLSALKRPQRVYIDAPVPLFPWTFLYDDQDFNPWNLDTLNVGRFWGFLHEIQAELTGTTGLIRIPARPRVLVSVCRDVDPQGQRHASMFDSDQCVAITLPTVVELGRALAAFYGDCLYFYGHADQADPPVPQSSWIKLDGNKLTVAQLTTTFQAPKFDRAPVFLFLNGCQTGPLSSWNASSLAGFLCKEGNHSCACLVTTNKVPAGFAAEMAGELWRSLLETRRPVGTALLKARTTMLSRWRNPLGLVYAFFGPIDLHVAGEEVA